MQHFLCRAEQLTPIYFLIHTAPLFAITFMVFETLQRKVAPQMSSPLRLLEDEIGIVRDSRLRSIATKLDQEFGLHVV